MAPAYLFLNNPFDTDVKQIDLESRTLQKLKQLLKRNLVIMKHSRKLTKRDFHKIHNSYFKEKKINLCKQEFILIYVTPIQYVVFLPKYKKDLILRHLRPHSFPIYKDCFFSINICSLHRKVCISLSDPFWDLKQSQKPTSCFRL